MEAEQLPEERSCKWCRSPFRSLAWQQRYCSVPCRNAFHESQRPKVPCITEGCKTAALRGLGGRCHACATADIKGRKGLCLVSQCTTLATRHGKQLCEKHYCRKRRTGTYDPRVPVGSFMTRGYVKLQAPNHPLADSHGQIFEHRAVLYRKSKLICPDCYWCGCKQTWATIHADHLNNIKHDNRDSNIVGACPRCNKARGSALALASRMNLTRLRAFVRQIENAGRAGRAFEQTPLGSLTTTCVEPAAQPIDLGLPPIGSRRARNGHPARVNRRAAHVNGERLTGEGGGRSLDPLAAPPAAPVNANSREIQGRGSNAAG